MNSFLVRECERSLHEFAFSFTLLARRHERPAGFGNYTITVKSLNDGYYSTKYEIAREDGTTYKTTFYRNIIQGQEHLFNLNNPEDLG